MLSKRYERMKYLILFLLLMFSCNVNAEDELCKNNLGGLINICSAEKAPNNDIKQQSLACSALSECFIKDKEFKSGLMWLVRSCNLYDIDDHADRCKLLVDIKKSVCETEFNAELCKIVKGYYKF